MTEDIIIQSEPERRDKNQISEKKFQNLSDFELKLLQRVRFRIKNSTTRQILNEIIFLKSLILKNKIILKSMVVNEKVFVKSMILK